MLVKMFSDYNLMMAVSIGDFVLKADSRDGWPDSF